ncbi:hypothetical protein NG800_016480 [Epilithonimonas ginsengisoli]|uniref:Lipoprotein n=1 Tax=Epilithonimonas ginsengisoli TaxID=1245592 RepID=A0ABU4JLI6_9FLAO|nr:MULTISPECIES: hypothetical protein [Chryseobacterium group]MBV6878515.1 hypothetical protein [Epilithonimonas sp. FP105]MDW8550526.1 hypothetical protein [Epilithonimonas ginsengisoli]OAH71754.1 hypothetical protein AXA65_11580 [Chryseobacterium sp. FP211-J200]
MKKALILMIPILLLVGCKKNKELALNEKVAKEFLEEMNALDDFETKYFSDSNPLAKAPFAENSIEVKDAAKLTEDAVAGLKNISGTSVSPEAMPFYMGTLEYIDAVNAQGQAAKDFFTESDPRMRAGYYELVKENFQKLRNKPDSILAIQKVYLDKVGIK